MARKCSDRERGMNLMLSKTARVACLISSSFAEGFSQTYSNGHMLLCGIILWSGYSLPNVSILPIWLSLGTAIGATCLLTLYRSNESDPAKLGIIVSLVIAAITVHVINEFGRTTSPKISITYTILTATAVSFCLMPHALGLRQKRHPK